MQTDRHAVDLITIIIYVSVKDITVL